MPHSIITKNAPPNMLSQQSDSLGIQDVTGIDIQDYCQFFARDIEHILSHINLPTCQYTQIFPLLLLAQKEDPTQENGIAYQVQPALLIASTKQNIAEIQSLLRNANYHPNQWKFVQPCEIPIHHLDARSTIENGLIDLQHQADCSNGFAADTIPTLKSSENIGTIKCLSNNLPNYNHAHNVFSFDDPNPPYFFNSAQLAISIHAGIVLHAASTSQKLIESDRPAENIEKTPFLQYIHDLTTTYYQKFGDPNQLSITIEEPTRTNQLTARASCYVHSIIKGTHTVHRGFLRSQNNSHKAFYYNYYQKIGTLTISDLLYVNTGRQSKPTTKAQQAAITWCNAGLLTSLISGFTGVGTYLIHKFTTNAQQSIAISDDTTTSTISKLNQLTLAKESHFFSISSIATAFNNLYHIAYEITLKVPSASALIRSVQPLQLSIEQLNNTIHTLALAINSSYSSRSNTDGDFEYQLRQTQTYLQNLQHLPSEQSSMQAIEAASIALNQTVEQAVQLNLITATTSNTAYSSLSLENLSTPNLQELNEQITTLQAWLTTSTILLAGISIAYLLYKARHYSTKNQSNIVTTSISAFNELPLLSNPDNIGLPQYSDDRINRNRRTSTERVAPPQYSINENT